MILVAALAYVAATVLTAVQLLRPKVSGERRVLAALGVALVLHAVALASRAATLHDLPITTVVDGLSFFTFLSGVIALLVGWRGGVPQVTMLATPMLMAFMLVAGFVEPEAEMTRSIRSIWLVAHIGLALLGDAAFAVAGVVSIVYLTQERRLKKKKKRKRETGLAQLPSLEVLDRVSLELFKWGFPLMTAGLVTGSLYGKQVWGAYWAWDPRLVISAVVWLLYLVMLNFRLLIGWRGRRAALLTVASVILILGAFIGLGLLGVGVHGREVA